MSCASCASRISEEWKRNPAPLIWRGILFAFPAAIAGSLLRAAFEGLMSLAGGGGFMGMSGRWFVFLVIAVFIAGAAKAGSRGKSTLVLQLCAIGFFYLAVSLAIVPVFFLLDAKLAVTAQSVWIVSILCLKLPFTSIVRNPINITGLIAIFFSMAGVWVSTAAALNPVDGPFEVSPPGIEPNFFKRRGPLPVEENLSA